jgi:uncharacterized protein (DUF433 family)
MAILFQHLTRASNGDTEISGKGLRVYTVLGLYEAGDSPEYIADEYDVPIAAVYEALAYAADHPSEMEAIRLADEAAEQRMLMQLPDRLRRDVERIRRADEETRREAIRRAREARRGTSVP